MTMRDISRMTEKITEENANDADFTWWQKILNWLAEYMLSKITTVFNLDEGIGEVAWYGINGAWNRIVKKIGGENYFINRTIDAFESQFQYALNQYLKGETRFIEALLKDLTS